MKIVVIILFLAGVYHIHTKIVEQIPASSATTASAASSNSDSPAPAKQRYVNGMLMLTREELEYVSAQIPKRHEKQDFSPIKLKDGTRVLLKFAPNGRICPRTGLPEGNISLDASIGIMQ